MTGVANFRHAIPLQPIQNVTVPWSFYVQGWDCQLSSSPADIFVFGLVELLTGEGHILWDLVVCTGEVWDPIQ